MIFNEKDFLAPDIFETLHTKSKLLYKMSKREHVTKDVDYPEIDEHWGKYDVKQSVQSCMRFRFWCNGDDVMKETVDFFGAEIEQVLLTTKQFLIDKGWKDIKLSNIWFQYGDMETQMHNHTDGTIHDATYENCFTSMIFSHPEWDNECGGQFKLVDHDGEIQEFNPDPNSLLMWNRDHPHWMTPIVKECPLIMFIGMSWYEK
jgi:hypothetical protein